MVQGSPAPGVPRNETKRREGCTRNRDQIVGSRPWRRQNQDKCKGKDGGGKAKQNSELTTFIRGLPFGTQDAVLRKDFEECGPIASFRVPKNEGKGKGKRCYSDLPLEAQSAALDALAGCDNGTLQVLSPEELITGVVKGFWRKVVVDGVQEDAAALDAVMRDVEQTEGIEEEPAEGRPGLERKQAAAESALVVKAQGIKLKSATMAALVSAQKAAEMRKRAEAAAKRAEILVAEMPGIAVKAANRAVDAVVFAAIQRMNKEASKVAEAQRALEKKLAREAAKDAQLAAEPWQQARLRAQQTMVSYLSQARDLANAVTHLKLQAPKLAAQARVLQSRGDVVHAQELQIAAHDLFDKAAQLAGQAQSFQKMAGKIQSGIGLYDLSAGAAASYASYTANPGGGVGYQAFPPLPTPLKLISLKGAAPSPAPAA